MVTSQLTAFVAALHRIGQRRARVPQCSLSKQTRHRSSHDRDDSCKLQRHFIMFVAQSKDGR